jgi:hypothetical protein
MYDPVAVGDLRPSKMARRIFGARSSNLSIEFVSRI